MNGLEVLTSSNDTLQYCDQKHLRSFHFYSSTLQILTQNVRTRLSYSFVENACGGLLKGAQGSLTTPNYPSTYPSNIECIWEIETNRGNQISILFEDLQIPASPFCNEDFLEIRRNDSQGPELGLYCVMEPVLDRILVYERVWLKFRSVIGSTGKGFKLSWDTGI